MSVTVEQLQAAAKAIPDPATDYYRHSPAEYERARAEFWRLYAKWLDQWAEAVVSEKGKAFDSELIAARNIAAEVEART